MVCHPAPKLKRQGSKPGVWTKTLELLTASELEETAVISALLEDRDEIAAPHQVAPSQVYRTPAAASVKVESFTVQTTPVFVQTDAAEADEVSEEEVPPSEEQDMHAKQYAQTNAKRMRAIFQRLLILPSSPAPKLT